MKREKGKAKKEKRTKKTRKIEELNHRSGGK